MEAHTAVSGAFYVLLRLAFRLFYNRGLNSTLFLTSWPAGDF